MIDLPPSDLKLLESLLPAPLLLSLRRPDPPRQAIEDACAQLETVLAAVAPFVPTPVVDLRLYNSGAERIAGMYLTGTVVFADLSGFVALASQLAPARRRGSEEMSAILNRLFTALLEEIYSRGGGLVKFGGDSITAFFDAARVGNHHTALACAAALGMQARMAEFESVTTSAGDFPLRLHAAVHSGKVFAAEVGDHTHTELIVTGRAINRVAVARESTGPGQVIISDETLQALDGATTQPKVSGLHLLERLAAEPPHPPPHPPPAVLRPEPPSADRLDTLVRYVTALYPYVPRGLPFRFVRASSGRGEFRPVTVLFANFYAFSRLLTLLELPALIEHDPAIVGQVLNTYYTRTQQVIHHYGGSVNKVDMATFGDRLLALFGAPTAHEDDPSRAVQAALALRAGLDGINQEITGLLRAWIEKHPEQQALLRVVSIALRQRIGVASGTVFAGIAGTPRRHEYTVMGETINLAGRLLSSADNGDILVTSMVHRAARHMLEAEVLPPLNLEGFPQPVPIFRALQARTPERAPAAPSYAAPLIGRGTEQAQMLDIARRALTAGELAGAVVVLVGEAGVGKSRLTDEMLSVLEAGELAPLVVRDSCLSYEQTMPYAVMSRLLRQALGVIHHPDREGMAARIEQQIVELVPNWSRFSPLMAPLLGLPLPESELTRALTPEQRRDRLHDLVVMLCFALARRRPLVMLLDDLQWADASSLALAQNLATELPGQPLLLILIYRPSRELAEPWRELPQTTVMPVGELARSDSEALMLALLGGEPPAELRQLIERLHGTPLFLEETVRYLLASGAVQREESGALVCTRPLDDETIPLRIEQLIMARLDRLPDDARALLQIAAVIGPRFSEELLAVVSQQRAFLPQRLGALIEAGLLVPDERALQPGYRFKHVLIRDVTYGSMLYARRRELHEHVADTLEHMGAAEDEEQRLVLGQHYLHAQLWDQAFPHFLAAARYTQGRYANDEALALYELALGMAPWRSRRGVSPDIPNATTLYENLGDVLSLTGNYDRARDYYQQLLALLEATSSDEYLSSRAGLLRKIGSTYENQGELDQAVHWLTRAAGTIALAMPGQVTTIEHARVLSDSGWVHFRRGDMAIAQKYLEMALAHIEPYDVPDEQGRIFNRLGGVAYTHGNLAKAQQYVEQSLSASKRRNDLIGQANALSNLGIITESRGKFDEAISYGLQSIEINEKIGNVRELVITTNNLGWAFYSYGENQKALAYFSQAFERAREIFDSYGQMRALLNLGRVFTALEQWESADKSIRESLAVAIQLNLPPEQLDSHVALAELALQQGDIPVAAHEHLQAQSLKVDIDSEEFGRFQRLEAKIELAQGNIARAIELLKANEALFSRLQNTPEADRSKKLLSQIIDIENSPS